MMSLSRAARASSRKIIQQTCRLTLATLIVVSLALMTSGCRKPIKEIKMPAAAVEK